MTITELIHNWMNGNRKHTYEVIDREWTWYDFATELEEHQGVATPFKVKMLCGLLRIRSTQENEMPKGDA